MIGPNLAGTGAMLARLVALGERCGLPARMTLIHVLDGAPLEPGHIPPPGGSRVPVGGEHHEETPASAAAAAASRRNLRATGGLDGLKDALVAATAGEMSGLRAVRSSPVGFDAGLDGTIAEAMAHPLKRDRIAHLYATTGLRHAAIGQLVDTSRGTVSFFLRELRAAGDPRVAKGDLARGFATAAPDEGCEDEGDGPDPEAQSDHAH
ncbi:MAG: hypothetical protein DI527_18240, partial [Chelatococcus sp.]